MKATNLNIHKLWPIYYQEIQCRARGIFFALFGNSAVERLIQSPNLYSIKSGPQTNYFDIFFFIFMMLFLMG